MSDAADRRAALVDKLAAVQARFLGKLDARLEELAALASASAQPPTLDAAEPPVAALRRGLHSLAGSAPTLGLDALGVAARGLEERLADVPDDGRLSPDMAAELATAIRGLAAAV